RCPSWQRYRVKRKARIYFRPMVYGNCPTCHVVYSSAETNGEQAGACRNRTGDGANCSNPSKPTVGTTTVNEPILETRGLTKRFKDFVAVNDVNLRVQHG